jgi:hypothetical protein
MIQDELNETSMYTRLVFLDGSLFSVCGQAKKSPRHNKDSQIN